MIRRYEICSSYWMLSHFHNQNLLHNRTVLNCPVCLHDRPQNPQILDHFAGVVSSFLFLKRSCRLIFRFNLIFVRFTYVCHNKLDIA